MAGRQQNIGGLAISLVADGGQLKSSFEEALRAYSNKKVKITLTAEVDETFKKAIDHLKTQKVDLNLVFSPRRDVLRQLKRDIQAGIENEGGIKLPISPRTFTKAQGQALANEVRAAVGPIDVEMVVNWRWGQSGPPPDFVTRGGGGGPGGPIGGLFFGRVAPSTVERGPTQAVAGANQVGARPVPAPEAPQPVVQEEPERPPRRGALVKREDESDEVYAARLTERLGVLEGRLESASERTRARANNEIARIEKILGMEQAHTRVAVPEKGRLPGAATEYPERVNAAGERVRGPASIGPLAATGGATDWEKVARLFFDNYAKREQPDTLIQGRELELQDLRRERTRMESALRFPQRSSLYRETVAEISAKERELAELQGPRGFRGQRTSTSFFSEGIAPVRAPSERAALVAAGKEPSTMDELIQVLKDAPDQFSDAFMEGMKLVGEGKLGEALEFSRGSLADLLARGRAKQIPGITRGTVARVLDPTKELQRRPEAPEREMAEAQFGFDVETLQDLIGAIGTVQRDITLTQKPKRRRRRKSRGAETLEPYESPEDVSAMFERAERRTQGLPPIAEPPAEELRAAGPVEPPPPAVPPGTVNFGGGEPPEGEGGFFAFGGGPLPVQVVNWPTGLEQGGPMAAGTTKLSGDEDFFQGMKSAFGESLHEFLERGGAPTGEARAAKTAKEKEAEEAIRHQRAVGFASAVSQAQLRGIAPTPEQAEEVDVEAMREIERRVGDQLARTRGAQTFAQQAVELSPARAVATAAGQVAANLPFLGGRSALLERKRQADEAEAAEKKSFRALVDQQRAYTELNRQLKLVPEGSKAHKQLTDQIGQQAVAVDRAEASWRKHAAASENAAKSVAGVTDIMRSFGAGVVGTITGQILFQAVLGASQAAVTLVGEAVGPALERVTGYHEATRQLTSAISDQVRASGGAVQQTVAQAAAQSNLSKATYDTIKGSLEQRAEIEAGNKAFAEQIKLIQASHNVGAQGPQAGLFATTGGFDPFGVLASMGIQSPFFGTPATQELLGQEMEAPINAVRGHLTRLGMDLGDFQDGLSDAELDKLKGMGSAAEDFGNSLELLDTTVGDLNERFRDTGVSFGAGPGPGQATPEQAEAAFRAAGFDNIADQLKSGIITVSRDTARLGRDELVRAVQISAERSARPDPEVLLAAMRERIIPATIFGIQQGLKNTLEIFQPAERGLQFAAAPLLPFGTSFRPQQVSGLNVGGQAQFAGVPPSVTASFGQYKDEAQRAIDAINAKAAEGRRVLTETLGVPESTLAELSALGTRIQEINAQQRAIQLDVQYSQFNRQLFIAQRTLGDLAGLTGRAGATQIGLLQREQLLLGRRSQALQLQSQLLGLQTGELQQQSGEIGYQANLLQLELQQRQINFQRSIAGFTAPGATPEERAARIEEAEVEADYAQRQLDFQKQQSTIQAKQLAINRENLDIQREGYALAQAQFANQVALQDAMNERAFQDQLAAIAEMQKAFDASVQIAALEELKGLLTEQQKLLGEEVAAQVQAEEEFIKAQAQFTQDLLSQTGEFVVDTVNKVETVFNEVMDAYERSGLSRLSGGGTSGGEGYVGRGGDSGGATPNAPGYLGRVNQRMRMEVGEAGTETVAILRNPREVFAGGGPGAGNYSSISILVTGNNVSNEAEEDRLAEKVARMVQEELSRRTSTFGLFSAR